MSSPLIERFGKEKRWVNWKLEQLAENKTTKIPYYSKNSKASSTNPKTWRTYEEASAAADNGSNGFDGVGIVLHDAKLICIDIDHVLKDGKIYHPQAKKVLELLKAANTFTEVSQSGTGLHLFFETTNSFVPIANKKAPFEIYSKERYIATTNNSYNKEPLPIRTIEEKEILQILEIIGYPWDKIVSAQPEQSASAQKPLEDDQLLRKMFRSKNGPDIERLYNGDISGHKNDESSADMALCSHLAFWTRKDNNQIERIWLQSQLGKREKTQTRKDYRVRTINAAIANCKDVYTIPEEKILLGSETLDLLYTVNKEKEPVYTQNTENMARILRNHPSFTGRFRYDEFKNVLELRDPIKEEWRELQDADAIRVQTYISILFPTFGKVGKEMIYDAIVLVSRENTIDSASDWIKSLVWDKEARLDHWISKTYNTKDDEYHQAVAANWMKGLVKRIIEPGCKFDYVLVLEGEQGIKKSTSLGVLGGNWHVETTMSTDNKDFFMQFQGKAIIEFSEGETLSRTEVKRMKAIITMQSDKYRPAYGRLSVDFPRRCVFAMTTNQTEYLKDETGNRRWLPVACVGIADIDWLIENRNQLFAEAYHRVITLKEKTYEFPLEATLAQQNARRISDPNTDLIMDWYVNRASEDQKKQGVTIQDVYTGAFNNNFAGKGLDKYREMSIASVLKDVMKLERKRTAVKGVQANRYFDTENKFAGESILDEFLKTPILVAGVNDKPEADGKAF